MTTRGALLSIVIVGTAARLAVAASIGPGNDEAYYGLFARNLDWSYFDHPPLVGWLAWLGLSAGGRDGSILAYRLVFIALFAASTLLMARLTERAYGPRAGVLAALILNATAYYGIAVGTFVLPDGPLLFFWLLTLERLWAVRDGEGDFWGWLAVGLAWGGALLSKYHAILLPIGFLVRILLDREARRASRFRGPILALATGVAVASPVLFWNASHGWVSLGFQGARALRVGFAPWHVALAWLGQVGYLLPWIALPLTWRLVRTARDLTRGESPSRGDLFFWTQAVVPILLFSAVACTRSVFPHWGLIGFATLIPPLARDWVEGWRHDPARWRRRGWAMALTPPMLALALASEVRFGWLERLGGRLGIPIVGKLDPGRDLVSWSEIARELRARGHLDASIDFIFTGQWYSSGQLSFALGERSPVLCYSRDSRSFAQWSGPDRWVGRDGLLVATDQRSAEPRCYESFFRRIEPIDHFQVYRRGLPVRDVRVYRCVGQSRPFPFGSGGPISSGSTSSLASGPRHETIGR